ncbi:hypothetical protein [Subtercola frigoramans]|uniref:Uncharacterized protein n=1 Tax=Subtercola frigoramans TaxID=120298 RepID=A0ABS2L7Z2_9MICO|nr:hypothetical protein [Subtercola frigoramans]MBM7473139.1 hypothetical protein [Subtercola frigoramans]
MDEALSKTRGVTFSANTFALLPSGERGELRESLVCTACEADAYFIREARNGRRACFGARPHRENCELASLVTEDGGGAALDDIDEQINAGNVFRIEPNRDRTIRHVRHDEEAEASINGSAVRYIRRGSGTARVSSMNFARLLRQLVLREEFRRSQTLLVMSDDSRQSVRAGCVHLKDVEGKHRNRLRVYWGTIRFPRAKNGGGAWLNTGRGSPTIVIRDDDDLEALLEMVGHSELEDLTGSFFAYMGKLRNAPDGAQYLFVNDLEWFAVRTYSDDADLN